MEGPSIVIAQEELKPFLKRKILAASGTAKLPFEAITGTALVKTGSWGKHLFLFFTKERLRIHFLMFGSYRINDPREGQEPKLELDYGGDTIYFYSCAIKAIPKGFEKAYDYSADLMSKAWDAKGALAKVRAKPEAEVADLLMDQNIFSGLGNIMKNETLFRLLMHPEPPVKDLSPARQRALVKTAAQYAQDFYTWKKKGVLKRNWKIMRKRICPRCEGPVTKGPTGKLQRMSHYCERCQLRK